MLFLFLSHIHLSSIIFWEDTESKEPCFFPFTYKKKVYSACTTDGTSGWKLWCSLTANYNTDYKWRYCEPSGKNRKFFLLHVGKGFPHKNWEDTFIIAFCLYHLLISLTGTVLFLCFSFLFFSHKFYFSFNRFTKWRSMKTETSN